MTEDFWLQLTALIGLLFAAAFVVGALARLILCHARAPVAVDDDDWDRVLPKPNHSDE